MKLIRVNMTDQSVRVEAIPADPGNQSPAFTSDPIIETNATAGDAYSASISDNASDPESLLEYLQQVGHPALEMEPMF